MTIVVPQYPFPLEDIVAAGEFREALEGLRDANGDDPAAWESDLADPDFQAAILGHWALLSGRGPEIPASEALATVLKVTEEQFAARLRTGVSPF